jgi:hypothetical protein
MIRHVVLLEFDPSTSDEHVDLVVERLRELPSLVPTIRAYTIGRDLRLADANAHLAVSGDFDDVDGYIAYRDDPSHRAIIDELILPHLASRAAVQHEL